MGWVWLCCAAQNLKQIGYSVVEERVSTIILSGRACMSNPCQNDGHCVRKDDPELTEKGTDYQCVCPPCASGPNCEVLDTSNQCETRFDSFSDQSFATSKESFISRLKADLLQTYDPHTFPVKSLREPTVEVTIQVAVLGVTEVDPIQGVWTASIWLRAKWTDQFLSWNPTEWGGVTEVDMVPHDEIWAPDISFYNQNEPPLVSKKTVYLYSSGFALWSQPMKVKLACTTDLTQFPFDTQECAFHMGSWHDHGHEVRLIPGGIDFDSAHIPIDEFVITPMKMWAESKFYAGWPEPWPEIFAAVSLQRHPEFYVTNLIFPT